MSTSVIVVDVGYNSGVLIPFDLVNRIHEFKCVEKKGYGAAAEWQLKDPENIRICKAESFKTAEPVSPDDDDKI